MPDPFATLVLDQLGSEDDNPSDPGCTSPGQARIWSRWSPVTLVVFDLLWQARSLLLPHPYAQRRTMLDALSLAADHVNVPPAFQGQAGALVDASRELGLEGVVLIYSCGA